MVAINHNRVKARTNKDGPYLAFTSPVAALDTCNDQEMSASFIISTNDEDREGDIIEPNACLKYLDEYRRNPIVLFDHDQKKVVGSSEGPDRKFYLEVRKNSIWAKCFFHDCNWEGVPIGQETYHLVKKRIFRGASIGFLPIQSKKRGYGSSGTHYTGIRFTEWSVCPLQSNQNALREFQDELHACLDRGEIVNKSLASSLRSTYLTKPNAWANGVLLDKRYLDAKKGKSMSKRKKSALSFEKSLFGTRHDALEFMKSKGMVAAGDAQDNGDAWIIPLEKEFDGSFVATSPVTKGVNALLTKKVKPPVEEEDDDEGTDATPVEGADAPAKEKIPGGDADDDAGDDEDEDDSALEDDTGTDGDDEGDEDEADDEALDGDQMKKPGAHILAEHMAHNEAIVNAHDDRMSMTDSKAVMEFLGKSKAEAEAKIQEIIGIAKSEYPGLDLDKLADGYRPEEGADEGQEATNDTPPEDDAPEEPVAKSLKKEYKSVVKGAKDYLEDLSTHSGVHTSLRGGCAEHAKCLGGVMKDMDGGDDEGDDDDEVEKRIAAFTKNLASINEKLGV